MHLNKYIKEYNIYSKKDDSIIAENYYGFDYVNKKEVFIKIISNKKVLDGSPIRIHLENEILIHEQLRQKNSKNVMVLIDKALTENNTYLIYLNHKYETLKSYLNYKKMLQEKECINFFIQIYYGYCESYSQKVKIQFSFLEIFQIILLSPESLHKFNRIRIKYYKYEAKQHSKIAFTNQFFFIQVNYRDITLNNIMIGEEDTIRIDDFGLFKVLYNQKNSSLQYRINEAPETQKDRSQYTREKSDSWSLGIILFQLLFLTEPTFQLGQLIIPSTRLISNQMGQLLYSLLQTDPSKRISWVMILSHPCIKNFILQEKQKEDWNLQLSSFLNPSSAKITERYPQLAMTANFQEQKNNQQQQQQNQNLMYQTFGAGNIQQINTQNSFSMESESLSNSKQHQGRQDINNSQQQQNAKYPTLNTNNNIQNLSAQFKQPIDHMMPISGGYNGYQLAANYEQVLISANESIMRQSVISSARGTPQNANAIQNKTQQPQMNSNTLDQKYPQVQRTQQTQPLNVNQPKVEDMSSSQQQRYPKLGGDMNRSQQNQQQPQALQYQQQPQTQQYQQQQQTQQNQQQFKIQNPQNNQSQSNNYPQIQLSYPQVQNTQTQNYNQGQIQQQNQNKYPQMGNSINNNSQQQKQPQNQIMNQSYQNTQQQQYQQQTSNQTPKQPHQLLNYSNQNINNDQSYGQQTKYPQPINQQKYSYNNQADISLNSIATNQSQDMSNDWSMIRRQNDFPKQVDVINEQIDDFNNIDQTGIQTVNNQSVFLVKKKQKIEFIKKQDKSSKNKNQIVEQPVSKQADEQKQIIQQIEQQILQENLRQSFLGQNQQNKQQTNNQMDVSKKLPQQPISNQFNQGNQVAQMNNSQPQQIQKIQSQQEQPVMQVSRIRGDNEVQQDKLNSLINDKQIFDMNVKILQEELDKFNVLAQTVERAEDILQAKSNFWVVVSFFVLKRLYLIRKELEEQLDAYVKVDESLERWEEFCLSQEYQKFMEKLRKQNEMIFNSVSSLQKLTQKRIQRLNPTVGNELKKHIPIEDTHNYAANFYVHLHFHIISLQEALVQQQKEAQIELYKHIIQLQDCLLIVEQGLFVNNEDFFSLQQHNTIQMTSSKESLQYYSNHKSEKLQMFLMYYRSMGYEL